MPPPECTTGVVRDGPQAVVVVGRKRRRAGGMRAAARVIGNAVAENARKTAAAPTHAPTGTTKRTPTTRRAQRNACMQVPTKAAGIKAAVPHEENASKHAYRVRGANND